jgi:anti-anti-sigma regulatory factor
LAAIITAYLRSRQFRGRLCLAAPRPAVLEVLRRTRLNKLLAVYASVEEALPPGPAVAATV